MTVCVFLGPTMPVAMAAETLDAQYLPPVRQGDVYRAVHRFRPRAIGIVDGFFHQVPSVWHKEILWAMAEGVHVFGSASMGALRAAELHAFGMQGVGEVFSAFRDQALEDDDEVAVVHGPEEIGFVAASEAMVNIRWTLDAAGSEAVIGATTRQRLTEIAKSLVYRLRTYPEILKRGAADGLPEDELLALDRWLEKGRIDVKRNDALAMLCQMRAGEGDHGEPKRVDYAFEHTTMWEAATSALQRMDAHAVEDVDRSIETWILDEIRLDHDYDALRRAALLRLLSLDEARRLGLSVDQNEQREAANAFRLERNLHRGADLRAWLQAQGLDRPAFSTLLENELLLDKVADHLCAKLTSLVIDELRMSGDYDQLIARARAKQHSVDVAEKAQELTDDLRAVTWYFEQRLGAPPPDDLDAFARRRGFRNGADFRRAVTRDYCYRSILDEAAFDHE
ncbi:MAG: TfuA-like protein [Alphaproteobacteria bacterium]|nr:TfuA-like protein [Alphaproteobacteria bacterium]